MAYDVIEDSREGGSPQVLYHFELNDKNWRYTAGPERVNIDNKWWEPAAISDTGVKQKGEAVSDILNLTVPSTLDLVDFFARTPPSSPLHLTIRRYHIGDNESVVTYVGQVSTVNQNIPGQAIVSCNTLSATMDRKGLRLSWSRTCPHALYDKQCKADPAVFAVAAVVTEVGAGTVTAEEFSTRPPGHFNGGYLEWIDPERGLERRAIEEHDGNQVLMFGASDGITPGLEVTAYPGCDRVANTCKLKFNNLANYGGIPSMPTKSPFDGDPVY